MLKKVLASLALVLLLAGSGLAADPIRIGYLVALTGDNAPFGITEANMARMIVDEQNEAAVPSSSSSTTRRRATRTRSTRPAA